MVGGDHDEPAARPVGHGAAVCDAERAGAVNEDHAGVGPVRCVDRQIGVAVALGDPVRRHRNLRGIVPEPFREIVGFLGLAGLAAAHRGVPDFDRRRGATQRNLQRFHADRPGPRHREVVGILVEIGRPTARHHRWLRSGSRAAHARAAAAGARAAAACARPAAAGRARGAARARGRSAAARGATASTASGRAAAARGVAARARRAPPRRAACASGATAGRTSGAAPARRAAARSGGALVTAARAPDERHHPRHQAEHDFHGIHFSVPSFVVADRRVTATASSFSADWSTAPCRECSPFRRSSGAPLDRRRPTTEARRSPARARQRHHRAA